MAYCLRNVLALALALGGATASWGQERSTDPRGWGNAPADDIGQADYVDAPANQGYQQVADFGPPAGLGGAPMVQGMPMGYPPVMNQPTPAQGYGYADVPNVNRTNREWPRAVGVRLDTSYILFRELETGFYFSEYQNVFAGGVTFLPFQSPCFIVGARALGTYRDNNSVWNDSGSASFDLFLSSRYKGLFGKVGYFLDGQYQFMNTGVTSSLMADLPLLGVMTFDGVWGFGLGEDAFGTQRAPVTSRLRRVEVADTDMQIRIGKFITRNVQLGMTLDYYVFDFVNDEYGLAGFCNLQCGRYGLSTELGGGDEGLRGFVRLTYAWGKHPDDHPQDCKWPVDVVAWATKTTMRDISIRMRDSFTGPPSPIP